MDEKKIVIDKSTFKALSVESRINILKLLLERNHTLTEVADTLSMSNSAVKEHLTILENAGLIKKLDEGRKWKYYKLTFKGKNFIEPREIKVVFALAISTVAAISASLYLLKDKFISQNFMAAKSLAVQETAEAGADAMLLRAAPEAMAAAAPIINEPCVLVKAAPFIILIVSVLVIGFSVGYLMKKKNVIVGGKKK
ncbi:winged helix-turn-helix transcriptional regulator [Candidatus Woesearchaeota archaeon]|nr:winged helix-turn-helix transcriptional regulator [Candidatus Woesearchaeota archaeon]